MTKRVIVATLAIAALPMTAPAPAHATADRITYTAESDGPLMSVSYYNAKSGVVTESDLPVQWSKTFIWRDTYQFASMSAQTTGTEVACQVEINGQLRERKSATGRYAWVSCSAPRSGSWGG